MSNVFTPGGTPEIRRAVATALAMAVVALAHSPLVSAQAAEEKQEEEDVTQEQIVRQKRG